MFTKVVTTFSRYGGVAGVVVLLAIVPGSKPCWAFQGPGPMPLPAANGGSVLVADRADPYESGLAGSTVSFLGPTQSIWLGGHLFFAADDGVYGEELWLTDGRF